MIIQSVIDLCCSVFVSMMNGLSSMPVPTDLMSAMGGLAVYGCWVLGTDLFLAVSACISYWFITKITAGLILFVWELLPLT